MRRDVDKDYRDFNYYPFGMQMPGRKYDPGMEYRYGFNSQERSKELNDNSYTALYWEYDSRIAKRWNVDPLTKKFPQWSPYTAFGSNPIRNIDPDGRKFINFDKDGNYTGTTKDNWWHNLWHGSKGRVLNEQGEVTQKFRFADPKQDVKDIQDGIIKKITFVKENEIAKMISKSGAFTPANRTENNSLRDRYKYIMREGIGGGKLDFSYTAIPDVYLDASRDPLNAPSSTMFLVGSVAHSHMNFGNFLFGAAGEALGYSLFELSMGAHYNSVKNPGTNGYSPQLDSEDDQYSIKLGFIFADNRNYEKVVLRGTIIIGELEKVSRLPDEASEH